MEQKIKGDIIFVWDETSSFIERIEIVNVDKNLMVDINKQYYATLKDMDICGKCKYYSFNGLCTHSNSTDICNDRDSDDTCNIQSFEEK